MVNSFNHKGKHGETQLSKTCLTAKTCLTLFGTFLESVRDYFGILSGLVWNFSNTFFWTLCSLCFFICPFNEIILLVLFLRATGTLAPVASLRQVDRNLSVCLAGWLAVCLPFRGRGFLGFGRNLGVILPTSLLQLPLQLRDLISFRETVKMRETFFYTNFKVFCLFSGWLAGCLPVFLLSVCLSLPLSISLSKKHDSSPQVPQHLPHALHQTPQNKGMDKSRDYVVSLKGLYTIRS